MLSDIEIRNGWEAGDIIIDPVDWNQLNPNSYDVRLGRYIYISDKSGFHGVDLQAYKDKIGESLHIGPGEFWLGHTVEFIGSLRLYAPMLETKSTWARRGIQTHLSAGFGDVGFANRWTLEIVNHSKQHVEMIPGIKIAQIAWVHVGEVNNLYEGKYVQKDKWEPEDMLPT